MEERDRQIKIVDVIGGDGHIRGVSRGGSSWPLRPNRDRFRERCSEISSN